MGIYNFQPQFVPLILSGEKTHTIRAERKHPDTLGSTMHLYTGLRQKGAQLLFRAPCVKLEFVRIETDHKVRIGARIDLNNPHDIGGAAMPGGFIVLSEDERDALAWRDGFRCDEPFDEMMRFWEGRLPFEGHIIHWNYRRRSCSTD